MSCQCTMFWVTRQWELVRAVVRHSELSVYNVLGYWAMGAGQGSGETQ